MKTALLQGTHDRQVLIEDHRTCKIIENEALYIQAALVSVTTCYRSWHFLDFFFFVCRAARVAVSKTSRTPSLVLAEHSKYANALILSAIARPSSTRTGSCFIFISSRFVLSSLRRSRLLPTRIIGTFGQKCFTSGVHFSGIFSRLSGLSIEKHIRMTLVSG